MDEPFIRAFAVDSSTLVVVVLAAAKLDLWAPLSTAFPLAICTVGRNALKGTPTAQPFDNRSIA
jgi:hypothetical protein